MVLTFRIRQMLMCVFERFLFLLHNQQYYVLSHQKSPHAQTGLKKYYKFQNNCTFDLFSSNEQSVEESFQNALECVAFYMTEFWKDSVRWRLQTVRGRLQAGPYESPILQQIPTDTEQTVLCDK
jgi:hypothetical protein